MSRKYKITDGLRELDLLVDFSAPHGFVTVRGGSVPPAVSPTLSLSSSPYRDGGRVYRRSYAPSVEIVRLNLRALHHDQAAHWVQQLFSLLEQATNHELDDRRFLPVYLVQQATNESYQRYAKVLGFQHLQAPDLYDVPFEAGNEMRELEVAILREPFWRSHPPETLPTAIMLGQPSAPATQADDTEQAVSNHRHTNALTHLYMEDNSLGTFTANLIASDDFAFFQVSAAPASDDAMYLGSTTGPWFNAVLRVDTGGAATSLTLVVEYWDGSAWTALGGINSAQFSSGYTGMATLKFGGAADWASTTVNGVAAYWVRVRISAISSFSIVPRQGGQVVYQPLRNYIEIGDDQIGGDVDALGLLRVRNHYRHSDSEQIAWVGAGMKSRGLSNFISQINAGGQNPSGWGQSYGTDTSQTAEQDAPGGNLARCTFATDQTLVSRLTLTLSDLDQVADYEGDYRLFLRARQTGGSAEDVYVKGRVTFYDYQDGEEIYLKEVGQGIELVDLGVFSVGSIGVKLGEADLRNNLVIEIYAAAASATPDLDIYDVILLPIDEWASAAATGSQLAQELSADDILQIDGGVQRTASTKMRVRSTGGVSPVGFWETRGMLPRLPGHKQMRLYFVLASLNGAVLEADCGLAASIKVYAHEQWHLLRGTDQ
jgi:hypothetical protein